MTNDAPLTENEVRYQNAALADENARLRAALESLTKDPPSTLAREPDEDWEVIVKMRAIARAALGDGELAVRKGDDT